MSWDCPSLPSAVGRAQTTEAVGTGGGNVGLEQRLEQKITPRGPFLIDHRYESGIRRDKFYFGGSRAG